MSGAKSPAGAGGSNPRVRRVADRIKVIVAQMLERRVKDPRLGFVTVTEVRVTGDTQQATIFYTVLGEESDLAGTAAALESAKGLIRSEVGKQLGMRHVPSLTFLHDALPQTARQIEDVLAAARASDERVAAEAARARYAGEADPYKHAAEDLDDDSEDDSDDDSGDESGDELDDDEQPGTDSAALSE